MITWQSELLKKLTEQYQKSDDQWVDMDVRFDEKLITLTIVSELFYGKTRQERQKMVQDSLNNLVLNVPITSELEISVISGYYTVDEAISLFGNQKDSYQDTRCIDWPDMANRAVNPQNYVSKKRKDTSTSTHSLYCNIDVYYSYRHYDRKANIINSKAYKLAREGNKVVILDFCFESPEINPLITAEQRPKLGLIEYLYDKIYAPEEYEISFKNFYEITDINSTYKGAIYTFDSAILSLDYISQLEDINPYTVLDNGLNLWEALRQDIFTHIKPDNILINAPSGLNKWTALLVTQAADKLIIFQNKKTPNDPMIKVVNKCFDVMDVAKENIYYNLAKENIYYNGDIYNL